MYAMLFNLVLNLGEAVGFAETFLSTTFYYQ